MKLATKFNLGLAVLYLVGLTLTVALMYQVLQRNARDEVSQRAGLMMDAALAMRGYTIDEIQPLLVPHMGHEFYPQSVPAYAATQAFENLRNAQPDYTYKEAALNPTNPRDRATDWEADLIQQFRHHPGVTEVVGTRDTPTGSSLYLARPIRVSSPDCLVCHSTPEAAPDPMVALYGDANGFGWQLDEVVGAQVVSVPMAVANSKARNVLLAVVGLLVAGFAVIAVGLNVMLRRIVVAPVNRMAGIADAVSRGDPAAPPLEVEGGDEIAILGKSFSRMRRSLDRAMKLLER